MEIFMKFKKYTLGILILSSLLVGCYGESKDFMAKEYGPKEIKAGKPFNIQPDGLSAIWVSTKNITPGSSLVLGDINLESFPAPDGNSIVAKVPIEAFQKPGTYPLYVINNKEGKKSNVLQFMVD